MPSSSKHRLERLLKPPPQRNGLDAYISIEQNSEPRQPSRAAGPPGYPDHHKHELQRLRVQSEQPRALSSNRHYHDRVLSREKHEASVQPRLRSPPKLAEQRHNRSYEEKSRLRLPGGRPVAAVAPNLLRYKKLPDLHSDREASAPRGRGGAQPLGVIRRPDYYARLPMNPYVYQKPDWWG